MTKKLFIQVGFCPPPIYYLARLRDCLQNLAAMSAEAIDYVKKPTMEFIRDSWRLMKRCTKPDRTGQLRLSNQP